MTVVPRLFAGFVVHAAKENVENKMAARNPTPVFRGAISFLAVYFHVKQDGLSKRGNSIVFYETFNFF